MLMARLAAAEKLYVSPLTVYEAVFGLAGAKTPAGRRPAAETLAKAEAAVAEFIMAIGARDIVVSADIGRRAVEAGRRYGKVMGREAGLSPGDCFAHACAQAYRLPLLCGDGDFPGTDLPRA